MTPNIEEAYDFRTEVDYCKSILLNLTATQVNRLELFLDNSAARAAIEFQNLIITLLFSNLFTGLGFRALQS